MLPQSYDFISKPARAFWEKFLKKFRDCVFYVTGQGSWYLLDGQYGCGFSM